MVSSFLDDVVGAVVLGRGLNTSDDPRVGSARDNATSTSAARLGQPVNSASLSALGMTFLPVGIYATVCILFFLLFRARWPRVYAPRTFLSSLEEHERAAELPAGWFRWMKAFYNVPDTAVLRYSSLDGYLFLRYLKILCVICAVGVIITWPVLLPMAYYGQGGSKELNSLTFGNILKSAHPDWYYVHACQAWLFFGFILYMISRECVYFINLKQAYLLSPYYAERLSSRTVLFTCVPQQILDERKLRKVFGDAAKHIWIPRDTEDLDELVKEREQTANRLEKAEIELIKMVNKAYMKAKKNGHPDIQTARWSQDSEKDPDLSVISVTPTSPRSVRYKEAEMNMISPTTTSQQSTGLTEDDDIVSPISPASPREFTRHDGTPGLKTSYGFDGPPPDVNGSVAAQWIPYSWRPTHRPLANFGKKVDTIKWTRSQLKDLAPKISKLKRLHKKGRGRPIPAVFVEFDSQANAQSAYQTLAHHRANHMAPDIIGVRPQEIVWASLCLRWWERIIRKFAIQAFVAAMVIFWSIPCAIVGLVSNVGSLTKLVPFLSFINKLPNVILGLISGLLPAVALALLMSAVPFIMRACARVEGITTNSKIELFTQNAYFVFQVVQVFLVTTLTSAVSGSIQKIIKAPMDTQILLSQNLPTASNFYLSYFILQGFAMSATRMVHLGSIIRHQLMGNAGGNPRLMARRFHRLRPIHWGAIYPVFTNMGVIALSYTFIAPVILGVALLCFLLIYTTYRYNLLYIYSSELDARGLHYPRALKQTIVGVYIAEICLIGFFGIGATFGPLIMIFGLLIFTVLVHFSLSDALSPLLYNLPRTLAVEEELRRAGHNGLEYEEKEDIDAEDPEHPEHHDPYDSDFDPSNNNTSGPSHAPETETLDRAVEGGSQAVKLTATGMKSYLRLKIAKSPLPAFISRIDFWSYWIAPDPPPPPPNPNSTPSTDLKTKTKKTNFILKWLHPEIFADYSILRQTIPSFPVIEYEVGVIKDAFHPPGVRARAPVLWIPRDEAGVSAQEVRHSGQVIRIGDEGAWIDERGRMSVEVEGDRREGWERVRY